MELIDIVRKVIGPIQPIGDSTIDSERYKNLENLTELIDSLVGDIHEVIPNKMRVEASMKRAGQHASDFCDAYGITE